MELQIIPKDPAHEPIRGELLNALNEAAPALVRTLAQGVGVSIGALRKMADEGRLTSAVVVEGLQRR